MTKGPPLPTAPTALPTAPASAGSAKGARILPFVVALFFAWGFATVLIDTLIPKLKTLFDLSYTEVMLTQFAFFLAYFVVSIPAGLLLTRIGYMRQVVAGLAVMATGCLLFSPAAALGTFPGFLVALFTMGAGITMLQVAANPLIALLGASDTSHSRLNLAQAFNSLGTFLGPLVGAALILRGGLEEPDHSRATAAEVAAYRMGESHALQAPFLGIAAFLTIMTVLFWLLRKSAAAPKVVEEASTGFNLDLLRRPRLALGALSIFVYVGAEVSIGSFMISYLMQPKTVAAVPVLANSLHVLSGGTANLAQMAGALVALYWGGAMVGRFVGSAVLRKIPAGLALCAVALGAVALVTLSATTTGTVSAAAIIAIGLCNAIMFPTIFTLGIEGLGERTPQGSGLMCLAIVGGAVIPMITGAAADRVGLSLALIVPATCYLWIAAYGLLSRKPVAEEGAAPAA